MKTTVVNIYGAPGAGKSTLAAELYAEMSKKGESVELVREVAKEFAWKGQKLSKIEQINVTTEQMLRESSLYGKVKYLITDSPIELGHFYCKYYHGSHALEYMSDLMYGLTGRSRDTKHLFLPIIKESYTNAGRYGDLKESLEIEELLLERFECTSMYYNLLSNKETRLKDALEIIYQEK